MYVVKGLKDPLRSCHIDEIQKLQRTHSNPILQVFRNRKAPNKATKSVLVGPSLGTALFRRQSASDQRRPRRGSRCHIWIQNETGLQYTLNRKDKHAKT